MVYRDRRRLRNDNGHRFARGYAEGRLRWQDFDSSVQSWIGHACHADTEALRARILNDTVFSMGTGRRSASV